MVVDIAKDVYTNPYELINDIKIDVGKTCNKFAKRVAEIALQDLEDAYKNIMQSYYAGYTSVAYYSFFYHDPETHEQRMGISHGYRRRKEGGMGDNALTVMGVSPRGKHGFKATIKVSPDDVPDYENSSGRIFPSAGVFDLMWNEGNRGLPEGYRGHIGDINVNTNTFGVSLTGSLDKAMNDFVQNWGNERGKQIADRIVNEI